ncbi:Crp/Fnr family transcriptional regulator [Sphingobacterium lactis]|uniref:Crp/Fnr family transcriptional regulator n=1 Tax=Sphingobacterium lactis TaxID=797291 RepID=UPI003F7ED0B0
MEDLIDNIRNYIHLSEEETELIKKLFTEKSLKKGENILEQGKICKSLFFVSKGLLRQYINHEGKELTIHFNEENTFACDFDSFISQSPSEKTIEALEDTELNIISFENLQQFYAEINNGDRFGRLLLEKIFSSAIRHIISVHADTAEQRYLNFLHSFKHLQQRIPQLYIASFIGVTPQSLSRIRRRIARK